MMAYRSSVHETTGESPVRMLFGREPQLPVDLMIGTLPVEVVSEEPGVPYVVNLRDKLHVIHDLAREHMLQASSRQKKMYDFRKNFRAYALGDTVYLHSLVCKKGTSPKFHSPWTGPYLVVGKISDLVYQIQLTSKSDVKIVHHDRLKPSHTKLDSWIRVPSLVSKQQTEHTEDLFFQVKVKLQTQGKLHRMN